MLDGISDVPVKVIPDVVAVAAALMVYVPVPPVPVPKAVIVVLSGIPEPDTVIPILIEPETTVATVSVVDELMLAVPEKEPIRIPRVPTSGALAAPGDQ